MSNHQIEKKLDLLINLLETMPQRMMVELEKREELKKALRLKELQSEIDFRHEHMNELNRIMFGCPIKIEANDPKDQEVADQMAAVYNHVYVGKDGK